MNTEYQKMIEAEKEALRRELERLRIENRELKKLIDFQMKRRSLVDLDPSYACM